MTATWITNDFLANALRSYNNDDSVEVLGFKRKVGFSEHFGSSMFQISIEFTSKNSARPLTLNVVIKSIAADGASPLSDTRPLFGTETKMYKEVIPAINQLFEQSGIEVDLAPE